MNGPDKLNLHCSQGDSPVSHSLLLAPKKVLRTPAISGQRCAVLLRNCGPISCLAKMLLISSIWGSTKRSLTWKRQDIPSGHSYFLLVPSARGMNANGLSSSALMFPTPLASDTGSRMKTERISISPTGAFRRRNYSGTYWAAALSEVIYFLEKETDPSHRFNPEWVEWLMGFPPKWTDVSSGA